MILELTSKQANTSRQDTKFESEQENKTPPTHIN